MYNQLYVFFRSIISMWKYHKALDCMCMYIYIYIYVCMYVYANICKYQQSYLPIYDHMYMYIYIYTHTYIYVFLYIMYVRRAPIFWNILLGIAKTVNALKILKKIVPNTINYCVLLWHTLAKSYMSVCVCVCVIVTLYTYCS